MRSHEAFCPDYFAGAGARQRLLGAGSAMALIKDRIGNLNRFYCGGRGLSGPDRLAFVGAVLMTWLPVIVFLLFEGPWMWSWISPAIPIVEAVLFVFANVCHMLTAFSDPGILPRFMDDGGDAAPWHRGRALNGKPRKLVIRGLTVQTKFCRTCQIHRPPRAVHCAVCDNCVDRYDHHCPWTGNCVGKRNYKWFLMYVLTVPTLCLFTMGSLMAKLIVLSLNSPNSGPTAFWEAVTIDPAAPIVLMYTLIPLGFVGFLLCFHVTLTMEDRTTNERLKKMYPRGKNPFSRGVARNMFGRWCGPFMPRYIKMHVERMEDPSQPPLPPDWDSPRPEGAVEMMSVGADGLATFELIEIV